MKRLYGWFCECMDEQATRYGQRMVAGLLGVVLLATGLLLLWLTVRPCDWLGLNG